MSGFTLRTMMDEINAKFDRVFERLDANDAKLAEHDDKFDQITTELHTIRSIAEAIQRKVGA